MNILHALNVRAPHTSQRSVSIEAKLIAALVLLPITVVLIYAGIHEYRRYKTEGRANYGLAYDKETGTTYVTGISEDEDAYDPNDFDPSDHNERQIRKEANEDRT